MAIEVNPDEDFHVVLNGNVTALSLNALDAAYQGDRIDEGTLIWQEGFGQWMRLDAVLAELENFEAQEDLPASPAPVPQHGSNGACADEETYSVQVTQGEVKQMSLDLMSDLYRMDVINDDTLVWQPGFAEWIPLCVLLADPSSRAQGAQAGPATSQPALAPTHTPTLEGVGITPLRSAHPPSPHLSRTLGGIGTVPTASTPATPSGQVAGKQPGSVTHTLPYPGGHAPRSGLAQSPSLHPASVPPSSRGYSPSLHAAPATSTAPVAMSVPYHIAEPAPRASAWYSRGLVGVAAVTMLFVANQNGVGTELTHQMVQGSTAEQSLPSLSRSTPYGLSLWLQDLTERYRLDRLSDTKAILAAELEPDTPLAEMPAVESESAAEEQASAQSAERDSSAAGQTTGAAAAFGTRLDGKGATARVPKPVVKQRAPVYRPRDRSPGPSPTARKGALPSTSDSYDPMNGAL